MDIENLENAPVIPGIVTSPLGRSLPTIAVLVNVNTSDDVLGVCLAWAAYTQKTIAGTPTDYGVRQFGCMPCGQPMLIAAPIAALNVDAYACPYCGPGAAIPISQLFTPNQSW